MSDTVAIMNLQSQNKALIAERDALEMENERLRDALRPFAFLDSETPQEAWDMTRNDRFKDWICFEEIECAREALKGGDA